MVFEIARYSIKQERGAQDLCLQKDDLLLAFLDAILGAGKLVPGIGTGRLARGWYRGSPVLRGSGFAT